MQSMFNLVAQATGEEAFEGSEIFVTMIELLNMIIALVAFYFAIRILPSISKDSRKRSWLFLSVAAITFGVAEIIGVLREIGNVEIEGLYEITETVFVVMFAAGFYHLYTKEHAETLSLKIKSTTDDLTHLYTHGFFQTFLARKVDDIKSGNSELTVLFLDIDDFKQYNDLYGHQEGDYVLRKIAQTITQEARGDDIASRYGGEEFTLILGCDFDTAVRVAERLRSGVEEHCSTFADANMKRSVTVSIGLASFDRDADSAEKLVNIADARMYEAKRRGKNQVFTGDIGDSRKQVTAPAAPGSHMGRLRVSAR